ncbi:MAG: hypothetical protein J5I98_31615 [Phaeodactylibacter sp.]|nr:hypothetical protein [Phaeodactylibacter sp.]
MNGSKLISLLETFSPVALNRFRRFVHSPYFNENESLVALFELIHQHLAGDKSAPAAKQLDKRMVWKRLYKNKPYDDAHLRGLASALLQLAYQFLHAESCRDNPLQEKLAVMEQLKNPAMDKHFRGLARQFARYQQEKPGEGSDPYFQSYLFHRLHHQQAEERGERQQDFGLLETADHYLDAYYFLEKLRNYCDALGYQSFLSRKPDINLPAGFWEFLSDSLLPGFPLIRAYYLVARMLSYPEEEQYFTMLKTLLFEHFRQFAEEDSLTLWIHLINYCIHKKINAGRADFYPPLFEVYRKAIETGLLMQSGVLQPQHYKNIITVGLQVEAFEWVEHFIREYTQLLPEGNQENALAYNLAKVYFSRQQYEKVIEKLREVEYDDQVYALGSKLMLLRTYFELREFLALDSLVESFRIFLRRKKDISREVRQQYMNVLRFVRKLSRVDPRDKAAIHKLREEVKACNALAAKRWIMEKVEELEG